LERVQIRNAVAPDNNLIAVQREWRVEGGLVKFAPQQDEDEGEISAHKVINNTLSYARELERIV
jgi:hypothetical protein